MSWSTTNVSLTEPSVNHGRIPMMQKNSKENLWGFSKVIKNSWVQRFVTQLAKVIRLQEHWTLLWQAKIIWHPEKEKNTSKLFEKAPRWGSKHFERFSSWSRRHLSSLNRERKRKTNLSRRVSVTNAKNIWRYGWYFLFFRTIGKSQSSFISQEYHKEEEIYNCIWILAEANWSDYELILP